MAWLMLANPAPSLQRQDLARMFTRLWSKQPARSASAALGDSDSHHAGLGLPLVALYAEALGLRIEHQLSDAGEFSVTLHGFRRVTNRGVGPVDQG